MTGIFAFSRRRWWAFGIILAGIYGLATLGLWLGIKIPLIGTAFFIGGLMVWFIPGLLFSWTGFFEIHEFGASPADWVGHVIMFLFYAAVALVLSWPFGRGKHRAAK